MQWLLLQIDRRRLAHDVSELSELRIHLFHLFLQMVLIDRAHLLRVLRLQEALSKLEPGPHIRFGKCDRLFVHFLRRGVSGSHGAVSLLSQLLGLSHVLRHSLLRLIEGGLRHPAHLFGLLVDLLTHCTLLTFGSLSVTATPRLLRFSLLASARARRSAPTY